MFWSIWPGPLKSQVQNHVLVSLSSRGILRAQSRFLLGSPQLSAQLRFVRAWEPVAHSQLLKDSELQVRDMSLPRPLDSADSTEDIALVLSLPTLFCPFAAESGLERVLERILCASLRPTSGGSHKGGFQKGGFGRCSWTPKSGNEGTKTGTRVQKPVFPDPQNRKKNGATAHPPKPPFYKTALLFTLDH